jgi:hypothetical protein
MTTKVISVNISDLAEGQEANATDVTIPLTDLKTAIENTLNAVQDHEAALFEALGTPPTSPTASKYKLYVDTAGLVKLLNSAGVIKAWVDTDSIQNVSGKAISGGSINNTPVGATTPASGNFTSLQADSIVNDTGLAGGIYTPTITPVANNNNPVTGGEWIYTRVGSIVHVAGIVSITPAQQATSTQVRISLPVASNFTGAGQLKGVANTTNVSQSAIVKADVTNDEALIEFVAPDNVLRAWYCVFMYRVL